MKPDFEAVARDLGQRSINVTRAKFEEMAADQLRLAYQEGIVDGLRQSETAIKAAFDRYQGRVEP